MQHPVRAFIPELFRAWRRLLSVPARMLQRVRVSLRRRCARWSDGMRLVWHYFTDTGAAWDSEASERVTAPASFGLRAFVAGILISTGILLGAGSPLSTAGLTALVELLWAAARVTIILLVLPRDLRRSRALLACAAGLAPYAIGVTPALRLLSLGLSAVVTMRGLQAAGASSGSARASVGWAFGGQAAIVVAGLASRGLIATLGGL